MNMSDHACMRTSCMTIVYNYSSLCVRQQWSLHDSTYSLCVQQQWSLHDSEITQKGINLGCFRKPMHARAIYIIMQKRLEPDDLS